MFGNNETREEDVQDENEEFEFYDMSNFEQKMFKKLDILETKIDILSEEIDDNNSRLKNIQFQFTRALIIRVIKWLIIGGIIYYVYTSFLSPLITGASNKYYEAQFLLDKVETVNSTSDGIGDTIQKLFPNAGDVLDTLTPGDE